jgi:hypothetical protein
MQTERGQDYHGEGDTAIDELLATTLGLRPRYIHSLSFFGESSRDRVSRRNAVHKGKERARLGWSRNALAHKYLRIEATLL